MAATERRLPRGGRVRLVARAGSVAGTDLGAVSKRKRMGGVLVNSEHVRRKTIKIGHQSGLFTEIIGGLSEGQLVLTHPDERIEDGVRVQVRD